MLTQSPALAIGRHGPEELARLLQEAEAARTDGCYREGLQLADRAAQLAGDLGDDLGLGLALRLCCNQAMRLGNVEDAARAGTRAVAVADGCGDLTGKVEALNLLSLAYVELALFDEALAAIEHSVDSVPALQDHVLRCGTFNRAGTVKAAMGDYATAAILFGRAEQELDVVDGEVPEARFCLLTNTVDLVTRALRAGTEVSDAELAAALMHALAALDLAEASGNPYRLALSYVNLGTLQSYLPSEDAEGSFDIAIRLCGEHGYRSLVIGVLEAMALSAQRHRRHQDALVIFTEVMAVAEEVGEGAALADACRLASVSCEALGDFRQALALFRQFHELESTQRSHTAEVRARLLTNTLEVQQLRSEAAELGRFAHEDALTGISNRRMFDSRMPEILETAPSDAWISLALVDVDHFKAVNDTFGHSVGDAVLQTLGWLFRVGANRDELFARLGGEEFVVVDVLPHPEIGPRLAEKFRQEVAAFDWGSVAEGLVVTASFGVVTTQACRGLTTVELLRAADEMLYLAKADGRNRVVSRTL